MSPTLVDELIILGLHDDGHHHVQYTQFGCHLAGAALVDLLLTGRIEGDDRRLTVVDATPTGHPVLDRTSALLARSPSGARPGPVIMTVGKSARRSALSHLVATDVLTSTRQRVFGVFSRHGYAETGTGPTSVRAVAIARIRTAVATESPVDDEVAALCGFVGALRWEKRLMPDIADRSLGRRLATIGATSWAPRVVRKTLDAVFAGNIGLRM